MCEICRRAECPSGCPNADGPRAVYECELCGDVIYAGDECVRFDGGFYCSECLKKTVYEHLKKLGNSKRYAGGADDGIF